MLGKIKNLVDTRKKEFLDLMEECRQEAYEYFDGNIRS